MVQIIFESAKNLWFLLSIPILLILQYYFTLHVKRQALLFANFHALKRITGKSLITRNNLLLSLRILTLFFAILAISGTSVQYQGESNRNDFVIALDTSASMSAQDVAPTRLEAAKEDAKLFLNALDSQTRVGLITFSGVSLVVAPLTLDKNELKDDIGRVKVLEAGGTDIPGAIITGTNLLINTERGRSLILITDGSNTIETFLDKSLQRALNYAQEQRVTINAIGIGTNQGAIGYLPRYYNVSSVYNEENLKNLSRSTNGVYAHANNGDELFAAFQTIADNTAKQTLRRDLRAPLMLLALFFLFIEWVLSNTRYRGLP